MRYRKRKAASIAKEDQVEPKKPCIEKKEKGRLFYFYQLIN